MVLVIPWLHGILAAVLAAMQAGRNYLRFTDQETEAMHLQGLSCRLGRRPGCTANSFSLASESITVLARKLQKSCGACL